MSVLLFKFVAWEYGSSECGEFHSEALATDRYRRRSWFRPVSSEIMKGTFSMFDLDDRIRVY